jgi:hypothetical protein
LHAVVEFQVTVIFGLHMDAVNRKGVYIRSLELGALFGLWMRNARNALAPAPKGTAGELVPLKG